MTQVDSLAAYLALLVSGIVIKVSSLHVLKTLVARVPVADIRGGTGGTRASTRALCELVDRVAVYSPWRARCLQRSAAMALLLRRHGYPAHVVVGCRRVPFASHAWVESGGEVVSDDPRIARLFTVVARF